MRKFFAGGTGAQGAFAVAIVSALAIAAAFWLRSGATPPEDRTADPVASVPTTADPSASASREQAEPETETAAADPSRQDPETPAPPDARPAPDFDEVRREEDGVTVIAGRGTPGSEISILRNGENLARVRVDAAGKFATVALIPADGTGHVLTLAEMLDGVEKLSETEIILAPTVAPAAGDRLALADTGTPPAPAADNAQPLADGPASAASDTPAQQTDADPAAVPSVPAAATPASADPAQPAGIDTAAAPQQTGAADSTDATTADPATTSPGAEATAVAAVQPDSAATPSSAAVPAPAPAAGGTSTAAPAPAPTDPVASPDQPAAPAPVLRATAEGVELLNTQSPEVMDNVAIDTISYSDTGEVELSGRAQPATSSVRVYLDNAPVASLPVDERGRWRGELPNVDAGIYTLRVDEVAQSGSVTSRVETPFKRESQEVLAAASAAVSGPISAITVQKGATLWGIARDRYGDGLLYVRVFEANRSAIRDPDLIYPGQIFDLPD